MGAALHVVDQGSMGPRAPVRGRGVYRGGGGGGGGGSRILEDECHPRLRRSRILLVNNEGALEMSFSNFYFCAFFKKKKKNLKLKAYVTYTMTTAESPQCSGRR